MRAAWYADAGPGPGRAEGRHHGRADAGSGEVRIRIAASGINPGDIKKRQEARAINEALIAGWNGMPIAERFPLDEIAVAHERLEASRPRGRVVVLLS